MPDCKFDVNLLKKIFFFILECTFLYFKQKIILFKTKVYNGLLRTT